MAQLPAFGDSEEDLLRKIVLQSNTVFSSTTPQTPGCCPESKWNLLKKWLDSLNGGT